jgi:addiction module HigA family antidote
MANDPRRPTAPGIILRELYLEPSGHTVTSLAAAIEISRKHMSRIVNGKARLEPHVAARLARVLGTTPHFWLNLQARLDAYEADRALKNWKPRAGRLAA